MMSEQAKWWAGQAGDAYHARNRVPWSDRAPAWREIIDLTGARSVYEIGCGPGWNLSAIRSVHPQVMCYGCDVSELAVYQARAAGLDVLHGDVARASFQCAGRPTFDLVFTCGVLIHVAPTDLAATMRAIVSMSARYVLAIEYGAAEIERVEYRGTADRLWRGPYGRLYEEMGLAPVRHELLGPADGFDVVDAWLLERQQ